MYTQSGQFTHFTPSMNGTDSILQSNGHISTVYSLKSSGMKRKSQLNDQSNLQSSQYPTQLQYQSNISKQSNSISEYQNSGNQFQAIHKISQYSIHPQSLTQEMNVSRQLKNDFNQHMSHMKLDNHMNGGTDNMKKKQGIREHPEQEQPPLKRKRVAVSKACWHCRKAHAKCSDNRPCTRCIKKNIQCVENEPDDEKDLSPQSSNTPTFNSQNTQNLNSQIVVVPSSQSNSISRCNSQSTTTSESNRLVTYPFSLVNRTSSTQPTFIPNLPIIQSNQFTLFNQAYTLAEEALDNSLPLQNDMTISLTQTIKQQAQLIQQLIERQNMNTEDMTKEKFYFKENPFIEALTSYYPCAIWKDLSQITHSHELIYANEAFYKLVDSDASYFIGKKFGMEDIPNFVSGRFGKNINKTLKPSIKKLEQTLKNVFKRKSNNTMEKKNIMDSVLYFKRKLVLNEKFVETTLLRKDNFIFQNYKEINHFDDEVIVNDILLQKTFETKNMEDITEEIFTKLMNRVFSAASNSESASFCNSPFSKSQASRSPSASPVSTPIQSTITEDELFPSMSMDDVSLEGLDFYLF